MPVQEQQRLFINSQESNSQNYNFATGTLVHYLPRHEQNQLISTSKAYQLPTPPVEPKAILTESQGITRKDSEISTVVTYDYLKNPEGDITVIDRTLNGKKLSATIKTSVTSVTYRNDISEINHKILNNGNETIVISTAIDNESKNGIHSQGGGDEIFIAPGQTIDVTERIYSDKIKYNKYQKKIALGVVTETLLGDKIDIDVHGRELDKSIKKPELVKLTYLHPLGDGSELVEETYLKFTNLSKDKEETLITFELEYKSRRGDKDSDYFHERLPPSSITYRKIYTEGYYISPSICGFDTIYGFLHSIDIYKGFRYK